uniref:Uncharacterized protein n=1 Tax=Rhizophora mucronata TaxID=61149 RepID=A0A2P2PZI8_RHIMU
MFFCSTAWKGIYICDRAMQKDSRTIEYSKETIYVFNQNPGLFATHGPNIVLISYGK